MSERVVFKYPLPVAWAERIEVPAGSTPVHFAAQRDELMVWVDQPFVAPGNEATVEMHEFIVRGTGHPYSDEGWEHVGSTLVDSGMFVFHLFWRVVS